MTNALYARSFAREFLPALSRACSSVWNALAASLGLIALGHRSYWLDRV